MYMRVSYNGYYMTFPRLKPEFDSLHPHQNELSEIWSPCRAAFSFVCIVASDAVYAHRIIQR